MTNPISTLALMQVWEHPHPNPKGKFLLREPLSKYIPAFDKKNMKVTLDLTRTLTLALTKLTLTLTLPIPYFNPKSNPRSLSV